MSENTRSDRAIHQRLGLPQVIAPAVRPEAEVPQANAQPESEASGAPTVVDPLSVPLPSCIDDLFDQWIDYPEEDKANNQASTKTNTDSDHDPTTNHNENAHVNQDVATGNPVEPPPDAIGSSDMNKYPQSHGIDFNIDYSMFENLDLEQLMAAPQFLDPQGTSGIDQVPLSELFPLEGGKARTSLDNTVNHNSGQSSSGISSQHESTIHASQPMAISAHTFTQAFVATTGSTPTPTATTAAAYVQSSPLGTPPFPSAPTSGVFTENLSPGPVVNFIGNAPVANNTFNLYYQSQNCTKPQPALPGATTQAYPSSNATPVQSAPTQLYEPTKKKQVPLNSTFNPTPLKQSWTSDDLNVKQKQTSPVATGQCSQAYAFSQHSPHAGLGPQAAGYASPHARTVAPNQYNLPTSVQPGSPRPQSRAPTPANRKFTRHNLPLSKALAVQRAHSCPQLQVNTGLPPATPIQHTTQSTLQVNCIPSHSSTKASTQPNTQVGELLHPPSPQQTGSYTPTKELPSVAPHALNQHVISTQPRGASIAPAIPPPQARAPPQLVSHSNSVGAMPMTHNPSLTAGATSHQPQAAIRPDAHTHAQALSGVSAQTAGAPPEGRGYEVAKVWVIQGETGGVWYNVEMGPYARPVRVYRVDPPISPPRSLPIYPWESTEPVQQPRPTQTASEQAREVPQHVHNSVEPQPAYSEPQVRSQEHMHQLSPWPVQRSSSAPSLPATPPSLPTPGTHFTVVPPPTTAFKPTGDDTFSPAYWQHGPSDPSSAIQSPNVRTYVSPAAHGYSPYGHAPTPGPSAHPPTSSHPASVHSTPADINAVTPVTALSDGHSSSNLSNSSRSTPPWTPGSPAPVPKSKTKGKKRQAVVDADDEIQEIPASEYQTSNSKGKRAKYGRS